MQAIDADCSCRNSKIYDDGGEVSKYAGSGQLASAAAGE